MQNDNPKFKIEYENTDFLIIDKPAGMLVYSTKKHEAEPSVVKWAVQYFPQIGKVGPPDRPGVVHRLDKQTSGLLLLAKTKKGFDFLYNLFKRRQITKEYAALVWGEVAKHGTVNAPLTKIGQRGISKVRVDELGKEALTEYWAEKYFALGLDQYSLIRVKLHTGRTHQIRAHMASIRHPVMGDDLYGKPESQKLRGILSRMFLHASRLEFQLSDGSWLDVNSELPNELEKVLNQLNEITI